MIDLMVILGTWMGWSKERRWYCGTAPIRLPLQAVLPIIDGFQFDNNGQNVQFIARKFILLAAWTLLQRPPTANS
jgi:hypothetical protein